jgi:hypothetical protein
MKQFVFIFRQAANKLSPKELSRRDDEIRAWAAALNKEGHKLDPRALSQETFRICSRRREWCERREAGDRRVVPGGERLRGGREASGEASRHPLGCEYRGAGWEVAGCADSTGEVGVKTSAHFLGVP